MVPSKFDIIRVNYIKDYDDNDNLIGLIIKITEKSFLIECETEEKYYDRVLINYNKNVVKFLEKEDKQTDKYPLLKYQRYDIEEERDGKQDNGKKFDYNTWYSVVKEVNKENKKEIEKNEIDSNVIDNFNYENNQKPDDLSIYSGDKDSYKISGKKHTFSEKLDKNKIKNTKWNQYSYHYY